MVEARWNASCLLTALQISDVRLLRNMLPITPANAICMDIRHNLQ